MSPSARILAEDLGFTYANTASPALAGVSVDIAPGSEAWVTGANAAGKSTLLKVVAGVIPTVVEGELTGSLVVKDEVTGSAPIPAMVMQDASVYLFRTVFDEVAFPLENRGVAPADLEWAVPAALAAVDVAHLEARLMHTLSGGERQKVAVAAALAVEPDLLLLDEPFEQLDPASVSHVLQLARSRSDRGTTVLVATRECEHVPDGVHRLHLSAGRPSCEGPQPTTAHVRMPRETGDSLLEMRELTYRYGTGGGVEDVDLMVRSGESVALLGPNGAGKTTIMKHTVGLLRPDAGTVRVAGRDAAAREIWELAHDVGLLFQNPDDQVFNRTVDTEVAWSLITRGIPRDAALEKGHAVMAEMEIGHLANENPHEITASQRQLVAFASVLVAEPRLIVLDEPTKALDAHAAEIVAATIDRRLDKGAGVLIVTHNVRFAARFADRCVVLADGRVIADAPASEALTDKSLLRRARLLA